MALFSHKETSKQRERISSSSSFKILISSGVLLPPLLTTVLHSFSVSLSTLANTCHMHGQAREEDLLYDGWACLSGSAFQAADNKQMGFSSTSWTTTIITTTTSLTGCLPIINLHFKRGITIGFHLLLEPSTEDCHSHRHIPSGVVLGWAAVWAISAFNHWEHSTAVDNGRSSIRDESKTEMLQSAFAHLPVSAIGAIIFN